MQHGYDSSRAVARRSEAGTVFVRVFGRALVLSLAVPFLSRGQNPVQLNHSCSNRILGRIFCSLVFLNATMCAGCSKPPSGANQESGGSQNSIPRQIKAWQTVEQELGEGERLLQQNCDGCKGRNAREFDRGIGLVEEALREGV
jgi:hypothetical protein